MKIINVGFMTESWDVKKKYLKEDEQTEMELNDPRKEVPQPQPEAKPEDYDPMNDKELIAKIKSMLSEYKKTKDKSMELPISELLSKLYAPEAKEMVDRFENDRIKTTRGNYGKYMQVLSSLKGFHRAAMVLALRDAGAGRGLVDAVKIIKGN